MSTKLYHGYKWTLEMLDSNNIIQLKASHIFNPDSVICIHLLNGAFFKFCDQHNLCNRQVDFNYRLADF